MITMLCILGLCLGVALLSWLMWVGAQIRHGRNCRGHRLGRWLGYHASTRSRSTSWWSI